MLLDKIKITNFKGFKEVEFSATQFSCLVGENNAGKSTLLQSIVQSLKPTAISTPQFYDVQHEATFKLTFSGITDAHLQRLGEAHRPRIEPFIVDGRFELLLRCKADEKPEYRVFKNTPTEPRYREDAIDDAFKGKRGAGAIRDTLDTAFPEFVEGAPEDLSTITKVKDYLQIRLAELPPGQFSLTDAPLPAGMPASISALLPEPIYIPAVKNLLDDLKTSQTTSFGKLLGLLLEDMEPDLAQLAESFSKLDALLNKVTKDGVEQDERHEKVKSLETLLGSILGQNFPKAKIELAIPPPQLKTILQSAEIFVDDGSRDLVEHKGDGIKRALKFALLQAYVQKMRERQLAGGEDGQLHKPLLFLFEEPELYLHPRSQKVLFDTLAAISASHQVIVTTHSPLFFAPGVTAGFTRVTKQAAEPKPVGKLYPVNFALDDASAEVFRLACFENADAAFFSSRIILFEGQSDDAYLKHVARQLNPEWDFDRKSIGLVKVNGKGNFSKYRAFFESFGMQVMIVADLDALFKDYTHLGADDASSAIRTLAIQAIDARIAAAGLAPSPSASQIRDRFGQYSFKEVYTNAKTGWRNMQTSRIVDDDALNQLDALFTWETELTRCHACRVDALSRAAIVQLLDHLRTQGICVLSKGAIEEYYPANCPAESSKPARALKAASLVVNEAGALNLSEPLAPGREPELKSILAALFADA